MSNSESSNDNCSKNTNQPARPLSSSLADNSNHRHNTDKSLDGTVMIADMGLTESGLSTYEYHAPPTSHSSSSNQQQSREQDSSPTPPSTVLFPNITVPSHDIVLPKQNSLGLFPPSSKFTLGAYNVVVDRYLTKGGHSKIYLVNIAAATTTTTTTTNGDSAGDFSIAVLKHVAIKDQDHRLNVEREARIMTYFSTSSASSQNSSGNKNSIPILYESHVTRHDGLFLMEYCSKGDVLNLMNKSLGVKGTPTGKKKLYSRFASSSSSSSSSSANITGAGAATTGIVGGGGIQYLDEKTILQIFLSIVRAVSCLHYHSPPLIHRDLKIENVLVTEDDQYKLCDFGSVVSVTECPLKKSVVVADDNDDGDDDNKNTCSSSSSSSNEMAENINNNNSNDKDNQHSQNKGLRDRSQITLLEDDIQQNTTFEYRAPEMVDLYLNHPINEKSDIWALGVLLYKLCYGKTPFDGLGHGNPKSTALAILNADVPIPDSPPYSSGIKRLFMMIFREEPQARPNIYQLYNHVCKLLNVKCDLHNPYPVNSGGGGGGGNGMVLKSLKSKQSLSSIFCNSIHVSPDSNGGKTSTSTNNISTNPTGNSNSRFGGDDNGGDFEIPKIIIPMRRGRPPTKSGTSTPTTAGGGGGTPISINGGNISSIMNRINQLEANSQSSSTSTSTNTAAKSSSSIITPNSGANSTHYGKITLTLPKKFNTTTTTTTLISTRTTDTASLDNNSSSSTTTGGGISAFTRKSSYRSTSLGALSTNLNMAVLRQKKHMASSSVSSIGSSNDDYCYSNGNSSAGEENSEASRSTGGGSRRRRVFNKRSTIMSTGSSFSSQRSVSSSHSTISIWSSNSSNGAGNRISKAIEAKYESAEITTTTTTTSDDKQDTNSGSSKGNDEDNKKETTTTTTSTLFKNEEMTSDMISITEHIDTPKAASADDDDDDTSEYDEQDYDADHKTVAPNSDKDELQKTFTTENEVAEKIQENSADDSHHDKGVHNDDRDAFSSLSIPSIASSVIDTQPLSKSQCESSWDIVEDPNQLLRQVTESGSEDIFLRSDCLLNSGNNEASCDDGSGDSKNNSLSIRGGSQRMSIQLLQGAVFGSIRRKETFNKRSAARGSLPPWLLSPPTTVTNGQFGSDGKEVGATSLLSLQQNDTDHHDIVDGSKSIDCLPSLSRLRSLPGSESVTSAEASVTASKSQQQLPLLPPHIATRTLSASSALGKGRSLNLNKYRHASLSPGAQKVPSLFNIVDSLRPLPLLSLNSTATSLETKKGGHRSSSMRQSSLQHQVVTNTIKRHHQRASSHSMLPATKPLSLSPSSSTISLKPQQNHHRRLANGESKQHQYSQSLPDTVAMSKRSSEAILESKPCGITEFCPLSSSSSSSLRSKRKSNLNVNGDLAGIQSNSFQNGFYQQEQEQEKKNHFQEPQQHHHHRQDNLVGIARTPTDPSSSTLLTWQKVKNNHRISLHKRALSTTSAIPATTNRNGGAFARAPEEYSRQENYSRLSSSDKQTQQIHMRSVSNPNDTFKTDNNSYSDNVSSRDDENEDYYTKYYDYYPFNTDSIYWGKSNGNGLGSPRKFESKVVLSSSSSSSSSYPTLLTPPEENISTMPSRLSMTTSTKTTAMSPRIAPLTESSSSSSAAAAPQSVLSNSNRYSSDYVPSTNVSATSSIVSSNSTIVSSSSSGSGSHISSNPLLLTTTMVPSSCGDGMDSDTLADKQQDNVNDDSSCSGSNRSSTRTTCEEKLRPLSSIIEEENCQVVENPSNMMMMGIKVITTKPQRLSISTIMSLGDDDDDDGVGENNKEVCKVDDEEKENDRSRGSSFSSSSSSIGHQDIYADIEKDYEEELDEFDKFLTNNSMMSAKMQFASIRQTIMMTDFSNDGDRGDNSYEQQQQKLEFEKMSIPDQLNKTSSSNTTSASIRYKNSNNNGDRKSQYYSCYKNQEFEYKDINEFDYDDDDDDIDINDVIRGYYTTPMSSSNNSSNNNLLNADDGGECAKNIAAAVSPIGGGKGGG
ncbi:Ark- serine/threonine protein kinase [Mycoemilia scoparia]|uniref:non-specific serine/threonine protein kinase n=1 Tax=Mycoemilia scoparia TaxID=417184 RepID=A0A9W8DMF6_9FUNG|nr:Ark- serine/threonine protein kinase [Mycoemilia scoparia]